jgi:hypothetical protein
VILVTQVRKVLLVQQAHKDQQVHKEFKETLELLVQQARKVLKVFKETLVQQAQQDLLVLKEI